MAHISVVVPVYKAEDMLRELYRRLVSSLSPITEDFEIVLVEDCGGDRSWAVIEELASADPRVKGLQFSRNFGQHYGITAGLDHASGDWVVVMDCDLQDPPEEIPSLYARALEGFDVVLALRMARKDPPLKRFTSWLFYRVFAYLSDMSYDGRVGNFRIVSRRVVEHFRQFREHLRFFGGIVQWMGFPASSVEIAHSERLRGKSTYTFAKLWRFAWDVILAYSDKPLRISIRLGFTMAGASFLYGCYVVYQALFVGVPVQGWSSLMASLYFLAGIIIANLGIIGIYIGKTFDETKRRPLYVVARRAGL